MGRFKITKQDMFIDMTPMSDVMVLLLTFFMLSATFVKESIKKVSSRTMTSLIGVMSMNMSCFVILKRPMS